MRSDEDLRAVLVSLERHAPAAEDVLSALPTRRPPVLSLRPTTRRALLPAGALLATAAAVTAVAVGVSTLAGTSAARQTAATTPAAAPRGGDPCTPPAGPAAFEFFQVDDIPGVQLHRSEDSCAGRRTTTIYDPRGDLLGSLQVYAAGRFDPRQVVRGRPVRVEGHQGYYGSITLPAVGKPLETEASALAWLYAPDSWAFVRHETVSADNPAGPDFLQLALRVAHAVHPEVTAPLVVPFRVNYPAGSWLRGLILRYATRTGPIRVSKPGLAVPEYDAYGELDFDQAGRGGSTPALQISVEALPRGHSNLSDSLLAMVGGRKVAVAGRVGVYVPPTSRPHRKQELHVAVDGWHLKIVVADDVRIGLDELSGLVKAMTFADKGDPRTWFDATTMVR